MCELVGLDRHDAVLVGVLVRHDLHAEHAGALGLVDLRHLRKAGDLAADQVVRQVHEERLRAHGRLRAQHRMPQTQRRGLADVDAGGVRGQHAAQLVQQVALALLLQHVLELLVRIEVILDGALGGAGDEHQAPRAGRKASSTAYWMSGLSTTGSISLGLALVAGRKRVPRPATGNTAVRIGDLELVLIEDSPKAGRD